MFNNEINKRTIHLYILIWILIALIIISVSAMVRYFIKGEDKIPFQVSKLFIVSTAQTKNLKLDDKQYSADIIQVNDIYISIEKNVKYKKDDSIKEIILENFKVIEGGNTGTFEVYKEEKNSQAFLYREQNREDQIIYKGVQTLDLENIDLEIANQGGVINFGIIFNDLGSIEYSDDDNIKVDGTLLNRLGISNEDIRTRVSFDLKIELESGNNFCTNIVLELPVDNILENGIATTEKEGMDNLIYKRYK